MRSKFDEQLKQLSSELTNMGGMIESAIQEAFQAFIAQDAETAERIMTEDDRIDREQKIIEDICFQLLVRQQPVARDLRTITAAMKMVTDMERIGDYAADISEMTIVMADKPYSFSVEDIRTMSAEALIMILHAVESYVERDMEKAEEVIAHDDIVDDLFIRVKEELIEIMRNSPEDGEDAADMLLINKYLERIADHAVNIAEWVIFSLDETGKGFGDVK